MPFYEELVSATAAARERFMQAPALVRGLRGEVDRASYLAFLEQAFHHVRHTVPLLMACGARLPARLEWLRGAIGEYIIEEQGHHEWILNDIRAAGGYAEAVEQGLPHPSTELMVAYAYDLVERRNPVGLFGMVFVLEGTSVALATRAAKAIQERLALPDHAFTYLRSHGALDVEHVRFFESLMNRLEGPEDCGCVVHAARMFYHLYGEVFRTLPLDDDGQRRAA